MQMLIRTSNGILSGRETISGGITVPIKTPKKFAKKVFLYRMFSFFFDLTGKTKAIR